MTRWLPLILLAFFGTLHSHAADWEGIAPRDEISPVFKEHENNLSLSAPNREGINGWYEKRIAVTGGKWYRFSALRTSQKIEHPRRSCVVRIEWYGGEKGDQRIKSADTVNPAYFGNDTTTAQPDFPVDGPVNADGSIPVSATLAAPPEATFARVQLHLRWAPGGSVTWQDVTFTPTAAPGKRLVRLAAVHLSPTGGESVATNRELYAPLIAEAAAKKADLLVLPEYVTCKGITHDYAAVAEPIPGPTSDYFATLAKQHDLYIVACYPERADHLVYNTAVLLSPAGEVVGKYRKVTLPREESQVGISPGHDYPVFETRFGKVGMMICYDVFFPEVARELSRNGAEIIALPIWGGNPRLAAARCAENGVYLVSSTYTHHKYDWMKTAVWDREGNRLTEATDWGQVIIQEVDLNQRTYWYGLGDFRSRISREAPVRLAE